MPQPIRNSPVSPSNQVPGDQARAQDSAIFPEAPATGRAPMAGISRRGFLGFLVIPSCLALAALVSPKESQPPLLKAAPAGALLQPNLPMPHSIRADLETLALILKDCAAFSRLECLDITAINRQGMLIVDGLARFHVGIKSVKADLGRVYNSSMPQAFTKEFNALENVMLGSTTVSSYLKWFVPGNFSVTKAARHELQASLRSLGQALDNVSQALPATIETDQNSLLVKAVQQNWQVAQYNETPALLTAHTKLLRQSLKAASDWMECSPLHDSRKAQFVAVHISSFHQGITAVLHGLESSFPRAWAQEFPISPKSVLVKGRLEDDAFSDALADPILKAIAVLSICQIQTQSSGALSNSIKKLHSPALFERQLPSVFGNPSADVSHAIQVFDKAVLRVQALLCWSASGIGESY